MEYFIKSNQQDNAVFKSNNIKVRKKVQYEINRDTFCWTTKLSLIKTKYFMFFKDLR